MVFDTILHSASEVRTLAESGVYADTVEEMMVARLINDAANAGRTEVMCITQLSDRMVEKLQSEGYEYKPTSEYAIDNAPHIISWKNAEIQNDEELQKDGEIK